MPYMCRYDTGYVRSEDDVGKYKKCSSARKDEQETWSIDSTHIQVDDLKVTQTAVMYPGYTHRGPISA